jgi:hypothetical protein
MKIKFIVLNVVGLVLTNLLFAGSLPPIATGFKENLGQLKDQHGQINREVKFSLQLKNLSVQLRDKGLSYELFENNIVHRIDLNFQQTNPNVKLTSLGKMEGEFRYNSKENPAMSYKVNAFEKVIYKELYKGIDLECYTEKLENGIEVFKYNFIVHPGANPQQILFEAQAEAPVVIDSKGQLKFSIGNETISERIPLSYLLSNSNKRLKNVTVKYLEKGKGLFGFNIPKYDASKTLVIDPVVWSTYWGGSGSEQNFDLVTDIDSNVYICGSTTSTFGIATAGAHLSSYTNSQDGCIVKFNKQGRLVWGTYFGGTGNDLITAMQINNKQELVLVGYTNSSGGIASTGSFQTSISSINTNDVFLTTFDSSGTYKWGTYFGGTAIESASSVAVDPITNQISIVGVTSSTDFSFTFNGHKTTYAGGNDFFLARFTSTGSPIWATYYGGAGNDLLAKITTDSSGNIYFGGYTYSADGIATINGTKKTNILNTPDGVYAIFSSTGVLKYATFFGSSLKTDLVQGIATDSKGNVFIAGETQSTDSIATVGAYRTSLYGTSFQDGMLLCYDTSGNLNWATYIGGDQNDFSRTITTSPDGYVFVGGFSVSKIGFSSPDALKSTFTDVYDGTYSVFSSNGTHQTSSYFGGNNGDIIYGIKAYSRYQIAISGISQSDSFLTTSGAQVEFKPGNGFDLFIARVNLPEPIIIDSSIKNNLIGSNQFLCGSQLPNALLGQLPSGGNGLYSYLWLQSTSSAGGPFSPASGLNTSQNYSPGLPTTSTWYKRVVFSGTQNSESNVVQISNGGSLKTGFTVNASIQCARDNFFTFSDTTTVPDITTRRWDFGDGNVGSNTIENYSYTFGTINYFNVKLYLESAGGCKDSMTKTVYLIPNPQPNTIIGDTSVKRLDRETYTVTANTGYQYNWWLKRGLGTINKMGNNVEVAWTKSWGTDSLYCQEQTGGGCYGDTLMLIVNISPANGEDELAKGEISLFPNPVEDAFELRLSNRKEFSYQIFNVFGAEISSGNVTDENSKINVQEWSKGYYFIRIIDSDGKSYTTKFLIADN